MTWFLVLSESNLLLLRALAFFLAECLYIGTPEITNALLVGCLSSTPVRNQSRYNEAVGPLYQYEPEYYSYSSSKPLQQYYQLCLELLQVVLLVASNLVRYYNQLCALKVWETLQRLVLSFLQPCQMALFLTLTSILYQLYQYYHDIRKAKQSRDSYSSPYLASYGFLDNDNIFSEKKTFSFFCVLIYY